MIPWKSPLTERRKTFLHGTVCQVVHLPVDGGEEARESPTRSTSATTKASLPLKLSSTCSFLKSLDHLRHLQLSILSVISQLVRAHDHAMIAKKTKMHGTTSTLLTGSVSEAFLSRFACIVTLTACHCVWRVFLCI